MKYIAFDTETYRLEPGLLAPPVVCVTMALPDRTVQGVSTGDEDFQEWVEALFDTDAALVGQNVSYDLCVIAKAFPHLVSRIWEKAEAGEIIDIRIREMLLNLGTHGKMKWLHFPDGGKERIKYSLAAMVQKYLGLDLSDTKDMEDAWRLRYNELDGISFSQFPSEAQDYALKDALYTVDIFEAQELRNQEIQRDRGLQLLDQAPFHSAVDFALQMITNRGMAVDPEQVRKVEAMLAEEYHDLSKFPLLLESGILRPPEPPRVHARQIKKAQELLESIGETDPLENREFLRKAGIKFTAPKSASKNKKALVALVEQVCKETETEIKLTKKRQTSTDGEVLLNLAPYNKTIAEYQRRMALDKLVTTEMPVFHWKDEITPIVYFNYGILKETGRTSSFGGDKSPYPARNGQQVDPRTRPCFRPRDGYWLASSDYNSLELCSTAHITKLLFGQSEHHKRVCAGTNMHAFLAGQLARNLHPEFRSIVREMGIESDKDEVYKFFMSLKNHEDAQLRKFFKRWRGFAKPVGLGYPGGLGAKTMVTLAHAAYKLDLVDEASKMPAEFFEPFETHPTLVFHGKRMKLAEDNHIVQWTPKLRAIALAQHLKEIWFETYPEMREYFAWVKEQKDQFNLRKVRDFDTDEEVLQSALCYTSPMGMHRANCTYTQAANGNVMQTPSAEGFKAAVFNVTRACEDPSQGSILHKYGCHVVNEVHDEIITEVPADVEIANECIAEKERIMRESMELVLYTVPCGVETALMKRWYKLADPVFNESGLLVPWEPEEESNDR
jgi:DNA polymerase I-like protein with 3'-5' exonuclease and polymerase domains